VIDSLVGCSPLCITVEESGAATYSCLLLVSSVPHFCLCFVCNYGVPRQHLQVTLEYPMGPLRHGGIGPIHISTEYPMGPLRHGGIGPIHISTISTKTRRNWSHPHINERRNWSHPHINRSTKTEKFLCTERELTLDGWRTHRRGLPRPYPQTPN
jgi:hypothetical protein